MVKEKPIKINLIKAPADFNELLDLQDLKTQMSVLEHLQNNLNKYQLDFVRSFIKTSKEVLDYIPAEVLGEYEIFNCDDYDFSDPEDVKKFAKSKKKWVVNPRDKGITEISEPEKLKFKMEGNILKAKDDRVIMINRKAYYRIAYFDELRKNFKMKFDLSTNELIECSDYSYVKEGLNEKW